MGLSSTLRNWFEKGSVESLKAASKPAADLIHSGHFALNTNSRRAYLRNQDFRRVRLAPFPAHPSAKNGHSKDFAPK
jgi:hypothetical protein